jgi:replicative DNA helicase
MEVNIREDEELNEKRDFGRSEEHAIIALAFDQPDFFNALMQHLKIDFFREYETKFVFALIKYYFDKHNVIISRKMCKDYALESLTVDDPHKDVLELIDRESDPREVPIIMEKLAMWAKRRAILQLYEKDVVEAVENDDFEEVYKIIDDASMITSSDFACHYFFEETEDLFIEDKTEKMTIGFPTIDKILNEGGPGRREVMCYLASTGKGKSIALVNAGAANIRDGRNVLHITLEMTWEQTGLRYLGCFTDLWIKDRVKNKDKMLSLLSQVKETYNSELIIAEFPPEEISIDTVHGVIDNIKRTRGINIDVIVLDYLELMISRDRSANKEDYTRQKKVCTEMSTLAKKENVLVITATQTNRSGNNDNEISDLKKMAESYGKAMPLAYLVSINQTEEEYQEGMGKSGYVTHARCRLYVAKNRNGQKFITREAMINYMTMKMKDNP